MKLRGEMFQYVTGMGSGRRNYEACHYHHEVFDFGALHSHDFYEIYVNIRGGKRFVLDDQPLPLSGNDLVIIRPFQMHGHFGTEPLHDYERLFLYITREVVEELSHNILPLNRMLEEAGAAQRSFSHMTDAQVRAAAGYMDAIMENCRHETPRTRLSDVSLMTEMLLLVLDCVQAQTAVPLPQTEKPSLIQQVLNYINENFDQPLSLDGIAAHFYVSKSYLSHKFAQHTSRSLYDYILYCRINRAKQLITDGTALTSISYQCGFADYSNFQRTFARYVGTSPSGYKKRLQAGAGLAPIRDGAALDAEVLAGRGVGADMT